MNRAFWFAAGAGAGVYAMTKARRAAETFTPDGLADRLAGVSVGLRLFGDEVRAGMADKENDVRERLGVRLPGGPGRHAAELDQPHPDPVVDRANATREGTH
jgi:hypothetical protein